MMPIQEALVWNMLDIPAPGGVTFGPHCRGKVQDQKDWSEAVPLMTQCLRNGDYIMGIIQTRRNRDWNAGSRQYDFFPEEDYLVAAFSVPARIGMPYRPSTISHAYVLGLHNGDPDDNRLEGVPDVIRVFQCGPDGVKLTKNGLSMMATRYMATGAPEVQAVNYQATVITQGTKYGWRGGPFPERQLGRPVPRSPILGGHRKR